MLVADHSQLASSATLGAGEAEAMSFSNDPALFIAMIANLYSNQKLAFIRETLCNAWDAHIEAGITDKPIHITITDENMLILRDFGTGIPVSKMKSTYNTLGGTTKRDNTKTTGGFGLGCKSPIAYVESFKVTTINGGIKAVYNMVRSAVELGGCPGLIPILQVPTDEPSGMELQIQLDQHDLYEIRGYIFAICRNGEMLAELYQDDECLPIVPLGMSFETGSYNTDSRRWYESFLGRGSVFIRYGNVIYPALETPGTEKALQLVTQFMNIVGATRILVQAEPSTLALAPSREAFTSQKMTEDGITNMCIALVDKMEAEIKEKLPNVLDELRRDLSCYGNWYLGSKALVWDHIVDNTVRGYIKSSLFAKQRNHLYKEMHNLVVDGMLTEVAVSKDWTHYRRLKDTLRRAYKSGQRQVYTDFVHKYVLNPIYRNLSKIGVKSSDVQWHLYIGGYQIVRNFYHRQFVDAKVLSMVDCKLVYLATRTNNLYESINAYPGVRELNWHDQKRQALIVKVGSKKGEASAMAAKFKAAGWEVVDLTKNYDWDPVVKERKQNAKAKALANKLASGKTEEELKVEASRKPNRLISVNCLWNDKFKQLYKENANEYYAFTCSHTDVEHPVYYIEQYEVNHKMLGMFMFWSDMTQEMKDTTIVCRNKIEVNKAINRGAVHLDTLFTREKVELVFSKRMEKYVTKERKLWVPEFSITAQHLKVLEKLGIKIPVYEKLKFDAELERILQLLCEGSRTSYKRVLWLVENEIITEEERDKLTSMLNKSVFVHGKLFNTIYRMYWDNSVGGVITQFGNSPERFLKTLKKFPEDIPAYKLLIKNILKRDFNHD